MLKILKVIVFLFFIIILSSCSRNINYVSKVYIYDMPYNLDPQLASGHESDLIINNIFNGLFKYSNDGKLEKNVVKDYYISDDLLTYTFILHDYFKWNNGDRVVADDFKFAFERLFDSNLKSSYSFEFNFIKNAKSILSKDMTLDNIGITIDGDYKIIFELEYPNSNFLELLSTTPTMPCNRLFYDYTNGRYGLSDKTILSNGDFYIKYWDYNDYIFIKKNSFNNYMNDVNKLGVSFILSSQDNAVEDFQNNVTDFLFLSGPKSFELNKKFDNFFDVNIGTWGIGFNLNSDIFGDITLRKYISHIVNNSSYSENLPFYYKNTNSIIYSYNTNRNIQNDIDIQNIYNNISVLDIIMPDGGKHDYVFSYISQILQKNLNIYLNVRILNEKDYYNTLENGDFDIVLIKYKMEYDNPFYIFRNFISNSSTNYLNYNSDTYDKIMDKINFVNNINDRNSLYLLAEDEILSNFVFIPLYTESGYIFYRNKKLKSIYNSINNILYFSKQ